MRFRYLLVLLAAFTSLVRCFAADCWATIKAPSSGACVESYVVVKFAFGGTGPLDVRLSDDLGHVFYEEVFGAAPTYDLSVAYQPQVWEVPDGWHTVNLDVVTPTGTAHDEVRIKVDTTPPDTTISYPPDGQFVSDDVHIAASISDNLSGPASWQLLIDGKEIQSGVGAMVDTTWDVRKLVFGSEHTVQVVAIDNCGNAKPSTPVDVYIGVKVQGTIGVNWFNGSLAGMPIHVTVLADDGPQQHDTTCNSLGFFSTTFDVYGVHDVIVKPIHWLPVKRSMLLKDVTLFNAYFQVNGDASDDGVLDPTMCRINMIDIAIVLQHFNAWSLRADLDGSGRVSLIDLCCPLLNYDKWGYH